MLPPELALERARPLFEAFATNARALASYRPEPYPGSLVSIRAEEAPPSGDADGGWKALARGGAETVLVPGNHYTLLQAPRVEVLAASLAQWLDRDPSTARTAPAE